MAFVWPTSHIGMLHPSGDAKARGRAEDFLTFAEAARAGVSYFDAKDLLDCSTNQAETRKSLFEELGLLFVPYRSNRLILTPLGEQFADLLAGRDLSGLDAQTSREATALLIWAQCRTQINRPQSRGAPKPSVAEWKNCDVKPYAAAWMAVLELEGQLGMDEFMGALRHIHRISEFPSALERIRSARLSGTALADPRTWLSGQPEMNYVIYWRSHLTIANQLMERDADSQFLIARREYWDIVDAALRFQSGCGGDPLDAITSASWDSPEDYFMNLAGAACPPFLATGAPKLTTFGGQTLADLNGYELLKSPLAISGGPELCGLQINLQCYHSDSPKRLLRIDQKLQAGGGVVRLQFGLGRPISDLALLEKALKKSDG